MDPEMLAEFRRRMVKAGEAALAAIDPATGMADLGLTRHRNQRVSYLLAWLYRTEFEGNSHHGDGRVLDAALACGEAAFALQNQRGGFDLDDEVEQGDSWSAYYLARTAEVLGRDGLGEERWASWRDRLERWTECLGGRAFFYASPNHEAWKCATLEVIGTVFDLPAARRLADFHMTQLLRCQMPPGFWEENRQHGPSTSYNYVSAEPLHIFWKSTGRKDVLQALERLVAHMTRYALPDGSTSGALDGRVHYRPGRVSPSVTVTAAGRRLNELGWQHWVSVRGGAGPATVDLVRFWNDGEAEPIPAETDGSVVEEHDGFFNALARRQGPWHTVLSGVFSDVTKETDNVYRLERQSRIDLWHQRAGLLIGGGSVHRSVEPHLANLFVDTGYFADVDFGRVAGRWPETVRATYYPRFISVGTDGEKSVLGLSFTHAQADFELEPVSGSELAISLRLETAGVRRAFAGLPLVLFGDAQARPDGAAQAQPGGELAPVERFVEVSGSRRGAAWRVELPAGARAGLHAAFNPAKAHMPGKAPAGPGLYRVALLVVELGLEGQALSGPITVAVG